MKYLWGKMTRKNILLFSTFCILGSLFFTAPILGFTAGKIFSSGVLGAFFGACVSFALFPYLEDISMRLYES